MSSLSLSLSLSLHFLTGRGWIPAFTQIMPFVPQLVRVFAQVVVSKDTSTVLKTGIGRAVMQLCGQYGDEMQTLLSSLPPDEATALGSVMKHDSQSGL